SALFFFQAEDGIRVRNVTGVQTCALPISWTSSSKDVVGCSLGPARLWFTAGYGIINEVYWPRIDIPQIRDLGFILADDQGFWVRSEERRVGEECGHRCTPEVYQDRHNAPE